MVSLLIISQHNFMGINDILHEYCCIYIFIEGDDLRSENPAKAIGMFEKVVEMETEQGDQVKWYVKYICEDLQGIMFIYLY